MLTRCKERSIVAFWNGYTLNVIPCLAQRQRGLVAIQAVIPIVELIPHVQNIGLQDYTRMTGVPIEVLRRKQSLLTPVIKRKRRADMVMEVRQPHQRRQGIVHRERVKISHPLARTIHKQTTEQVSLLTIQVRPSKLIMLMAVHRAANIRKTIQQRRSTIT